MNSTQIFTDDFLTIYLPFYGILSMNYDAVWGRSLFFMQSKYWCFFSSVWFLWDLLQYICRLYTYSAKYAFWARHPCFISFETKCFIFYYKQLPLLSFLLDSSTIYHNCIFLNIPNKKLIEIKHIFELFATFW